MLLLVITITNIIISAWYWHILCIIFETEAWLLAAVRFDQRGCVLGLTCHSSHDVCADVRIWSPGDVIRSPNIQSEILLPGSIDWAPLHTAITGVSSSTHESTVLQSVLPSVILSCWQHAGGPGWWVIYLGSGTTRDKNSSWNVNNVWLGVKDQNIFPLQICC